MLTSLLVATLTTLSATAKLTFDPMSQDPDLTSLLRFQNIESWKLTFTGESLTGKTYEIRVKRFDNGKKVVDQLHLDAGELPGTMGKVDKGELKLTLMSQAKEGQAKIEFQTPRFGNARTYEAKKTKFDYVMKNFLGAERSMSFDPSQETYFLAYLQPFEHGDGSTSYCEVAQSGQDPEKLFEKFKVPTYFLVSIKFK